MLTNLILTIRLSGFIAEKARMGAQTRDAKHERENSAPLFLGQALVPPGKNNDNLIRSDQSAQECKSNYYRRETR